MQHRTLGQALTVSALGLGCMGMSEFYGARDDAQSLAVLHRAADLGVTFFDTADMYGPFHNEELLGRFLAERGRDGMVIATKFGVDRRGVAPTARVINNSPDYIRACCEASLTRLGIDCIDLYYVHRIDPAQPIETTMQALAELVTAGKIAHVGLSEASAATLRRAHAVHPVTALQTEYSLWTRDVEAEILPTCRALGIGFVAYSPLGRGFLTGSFTAETKLEAGDFRAHLPRFADDNRAANLAIVEAVRTLAQARGCTPAQLALAWVLARGQDIVPIPGTKRIAYLEDNLAAAALVLSDPEVAALDAAVAATAVVGERYAPAGMRTIGI